MAETNQTPLRIYEAGEPELRAHTEAYQSVLNQQAALEASLAEAKARTATAEATTNTYRQELLERVHESITPTTNPGEYLQAVLNIYHGGNRVGDMIAERLAPLRQHLREQAGPIAIVGAWDAYLVLGVSAGDIMVSRSPEHEKNAFPELLGLLQLHLPLHYSNQYRSYPRSPAIWDYIDHDPNPHRIRVRQFLSTLRVAGSLTELQTSQQDVADSGPTDDDFRYYERDVQFKTGFKPVIAYGDMAVRGLLTAIIEHHRTKQETATDPSFLDNLVAAAISLDIAPHSITDIDETVLQERLHHQFLQQLSEDVAHTISEEVHARLSAAQPRPIRWPIIASPQVMRYAGVTPNEIIGAMEQGMEEVVDDLRLDDPADQPPRPVRQEYRLLEPEAKQQATGLIALRYGLIIQPSTLSNETVRRQLTERLERTAPQRELQGRKKPLSNQP